VTPASRFGATSEYPVGDEFMAQVLDKSYVPPAGLVKYQPEFGSVQAADFRQLRSAKHSFQVFYGENMVTVPFFLACAGFSVHTAAQCGPVVP
jgi:hypothetical protein